MSTTDSASLAQRSAAALTECMTVLGDTPPVAGDSERFEVISQSGSSYVVDLRAQSCECPDALHRAPTGGCKHLRRVEYATGRASIPGWADRAAIDDQLGEHVTGQPRIARLDGTTEVL